MSSQNEATAENVISLILPSYGISSHILTSKVNMNTQAWFLRWFPWFLYWHVYTFMVPNYGEGKMRLTFCYLAAISTPLKYIWINFQYTNMLRIIWAIDYNHQLIKTFIDIAWSVIFIRNMGFEFGQGQLYICSYISNWCVQFVLFVLPSSMVTTAAYNGTRL